MTGRIFSVKRLAVHDGPGIRTTIFMKGCPLKCRWCHTPEGISINPEIGFLENRCIGCKKCAEVCPVGAHIFNNGHHIFNRAKCDACGKCVEVCLSGALEYYGQEVSSEDVVKLVMEDRTFYEQSGGGCTLSGGEPLIQPEFCLEVLRLLKRRGIHRAIDTSGAVGWKVFEVILPYTDMILYDLKHTDDKLHREYTGCSNTQIMENLERLSRIGIPLEIRIPLIPGFNADERSISNMGRFLCSVKGISEVRLLPYHKPNSKYNAVGYHYTMQNISPPTGAQIQKIVSTLKTFGLKVTV
jgi:glycyl-radical enzyme activating protein